MNLIKLTFTLALRALHYLADLATPKRNVACFISFPDIEDNALAVFTEAIESGAYQHCTLVWLVRNSESARKRLSELFENNVMGKCVVANKNSLTGLYYFLTSKRVYFTHGHYPFATKGRLSGKLINLWHGMPIKAIGTHVHKTLQFSQISHHSIASSNFFVPIIAKSFNINSADISVTGLPRCDILVQSSNSPKPIIDIKKSPDCKIVCWLPTYRISNVGDKRNDSTLSITQYLEDFNASMAALSQAALSYHIQIVLKLHPMDALNEHALTLPNNIILFSPSTSKLTTYQLLAASDGLISDISSVMFDYMCTTKPILVHTAPLHKYSRAIIFPVEKLTNAVHNCTDFEGATPFFHDVMRENRYDPEQLQFFCEHFDSMSSKRVLEKFPLPRT